MAYQNEKHPDSVNEELYRGDMILAVSFTNRPDASI